MLNQQLTGLRVFYTNNGCDKITDCLDGSDEEPSICDESYRPGRGSCTVVLPVYQTCFPLAASEVIIRRVITKITRSSFLPQFFEGSAIDDYTFKDSMGRNVKGSIPVKFNYHFATMVSNWYMTNKQYRLRAMANFTFSRGVAYGQIYKGSRLDEVCSDHAIWKCGA
ncbi:unnamed protein product [Owenia fusiformis]|uniref:Uncharacterized protein n=1 Tax=Owenia fusiformis TaxID=6347 RepID=A0A8S4N468_OWEFU|nr:unnamed protein product [Owenia fusiformis]